MFWCFQCSTDLLYGYYAAEFTESCHNKTYRLKRQQIDKNRQKRRIDHPPPHFVLCDRRLASKITRQCWCVHGTAPGYFTNCECGFFFFLLKNSTGGLLCERSEHTQLARRPYVSRNVSDDDALSITHTRTTWLCLGFYGHFNSIEWTAWQLNTHTYTHTLT